MSDIKEKQVYKGYEDVRAKLHELSDQGLKIEEYKDLEFCVLIGSRAASYWGCLSRPLDVDADWDLVATADWVFHGLLYQLDPKSICLTIYPNQSFAKLTGNIGSKYRFDVELLIRPDSSTARLLHKKKDISDGTIPLPITAFGLGGCKVFVPVVSPVYLEAIKHSHIIWPRDFRKHMEDLHALRAYLKTHRENLNLEFAFKRREEHLRMHDGKDPAAHVNLNVTNEAFLETVPLMVKKYIKHDDLHLQVMYGDKPMYTRLKAETKEAQDKAICDKKLWEALTHDERIKDVREEAMVLALERFLLPEIETDDPYLDALELICTTTTKGWFRQFAIDHYVEISKLDRDLRKIYDKVKQLAATRQQKEADEEKCKIEDKDLKQAQYWDSILEKAIDKFYPIYGLPTGYDEKQPDRAYLVFCHDSNSGRWESNGDCTRSKHYFGWIYTRLMSASDFKALQTVEGKRRAFTDKLFRKAQGYSKGFSFIARINATTGGSFGDDRVTFMAQHKVIPKAALKMQVPFDVLARYVFNKLRPHMQGNGEQVLQYEWERRNLAPLPRPINGVNRWLFYWLNLKPYESQ